MTFATLLTIAGTALLGYAAFFERPGTPPPRLSATAIAFFLIAVAVFIAPLIR